METAPWLQVSYNQNVVIVEHELASIPLGHGKFCEKESLNYEVYHCYLDQRDFSQDSFFNAIRQLRTVEGAQQFGRKASVLL